MKKLLLMLALVLVATLIGCGFPGEPMLDDAYPRDVYMTEGHEITFEGDSRWYDQKTMPIQTMRIIAFGVPTRVTRGIFQGFSLPIWNAGGNVNEELYSCQCVAGNWDVTTDFILYVGGWLDTANDTKRFQLRVSFEHWTAGDVVPVTVTDVDVETITGNWAQFTSFKVGFTLDSTGIEEGDALGIRLRRIDATADEIAGEVVVEGMVLVYRADSFGNLTP